MSRLRSTRWGWWTASHRAGWWAILLLPSPVPCTWLCGFCWIETARRCQMCCTWLASSSFLSLKYDCEAFVFQFTFHHRSTVFECSMSNRHVCLNCLPALLTDHAAAAAAAAAAATFRKQAKKEEISTKTPSDIKFEEMQQYANNLDVQVNLELSLSASPSPFHCPDPPPSFSGSLRPLSATPSESLWTVPTKPHPTRRSRIPYADQLRCDSFSGLCIRWLVFWGDHNRCRTWRGTPRR